MRPGGAAARRPGRSGLGRWSGPCDPGEGPPGESAAGCPAGAEGTESGLSAGLLEAGEPYLAAEIGRGRARQRRGRGRVRAPATPPPGAHSPTPPAKGVLSSTGSLLLPRPGHLFAALFWQDPEDEHCRAPGAGRPPRQLPLLGPSEALAPPPSARGAPGRGGAAFPGGMGKAFPQPAPAPQGCWAAASTPPWGGAVGKKLLPDPAPRHTQTSCRSFLVSTRAR